MSNDENEILENYLSELTESFAAIEKQENKKPIEPHQPVKAPSKAVPDENIQKLIKNQKEEYAEIYCEMVKHILLCIFTCGIWYMIWIYKATRYLNRAPDGEQYNPTNKLLLCLFVPFYQIYWFYKHGQKLDSMMKARKLGSSDMATLCLILGIIIPVVACILMQDKFNQLCTVNVIDQREEKPIQKTENEAIENLERYKQLLDKGIITQEEFDAKKKQLLGL